MKKSDRIFFGLATAIPWIFVISILTFFIHAGIILGRMPDVGNPEPWSLSFYGVYSILINVFFLIWITTFLFWVIVFIIFLQHNRTGDYKRPILLILTGHFVAFIILFSHIFTWYADFD